jgi:hypothetical protein
MKIKVLLCASILFITVMANANTVLTVGQPGNSQLATPTGPSPKLGSLINFDSLTPFSTFDPNTFASRGVTISSPDGLTVYPFSTQSGPNYLYDGSGDGTADITIKLGGGVNAIGVGIADSDPVSIILQALGQNGLALGQAFTIDLASTESQINTGNGYYVISDSSADIYGLRILQTSSDPANFSGLAIDDIQVTPEPGSMMLFGSGMAFLGSLRLRKRA